MMEDCMKECSANDLKQVIKNDIGSDVFYDLTLRSIESHMSFDYLNLLYNNGIKLNEIMSYDYISDLIRHFASDMRNVSRATNNFVNMEGITDDEIKNFYDLKIEKREDTKYIGFYLAIKKIIEEEKINGMDANTMYSRFLSYMDGVGKQIDVFEQIFNLFKDDIDYTNRHSQVITYIARYTVFRGSQDVKDYLNKKAESSDFLRELIERYTREYERMQGNKKNKVTITTSDITDNGVYVTVAATNAQEGIGYPF
jgi:hypothetical protein